MPSLSKPRKRLGLVEPAKISADLSTFKMADVSMKKVKDLMAKKGAIEKEIKEFQEVLDSVSLSSSIFFLHLIFLRRDITLFVYYTAKGSRDARKVDRRRKLPSLRY